MDTSLLRGFAENEALMQVVKELLLKQFSVDSLTVTQADIELGQMVRARLVGLKAIEDAFREIKQHKSNFSHERKQNPAR